MSDQTIDDIVLEATRSARELSALLTKAEEMGEPIEVEVKRLPVAGRSPIVSVVVMPTRHEGSPAG